MRVKFFYFLVFLLIINSGIFGQSVGVLYPHFRQIFQRNSLNEADFSVLGNCHENSTLVQYKLVPVEKGQGIAIDWSNLDESPGGGFFQGKIKAKGGWYALWVRSMDDNKVWQDSTMLSRVGVGENFIIAGQSNAQGGSKRKPIEKGASDDRVNCANFYNFFAESNSNPTHKVFGERSLDFPFDNFTKMDDNATIGPTGLSLYYWPILGDSLVKKLNVPVCFYNAAWFGTTMKNWLESAKGLPSANPWTNNTVFYTDGFPYINLKKVVEAFGVKGGVRSILWLQGETDNNFETTGPAYYSQFTELISIFRKQTGLDIPWVIAEASFTANRYEKGACTPPLWNPSIIKAQQDVVTISQISEMYGGPNFDQTEVPRKDDLYSLCVHFTPDAYSQVANAWLKKLDDKFFKNSKAILPLSLPQFNKKCGTNNETIVSVSNVSEKTKIEWYNESLAFIGSDKSKQVFTPGKYFLKTIDPLGNEFIVPFFQIKNLPLPQKPSILANSLTTICSGLSVNLSISVNAGKVLWSTGSALSTIEVKNQGDYKVKTWNKFECSSEFSPSTKITVVDNPSPPSVSLLSPYFLTGGQKTSDIDLNWSLNNAAINTEKGANLRVKTSGKYSVYASKKYVDGPTCLSSSYDITYTLPQDGGLSIFPNPVANMLTIQSVSSLQGSEYTIYASDGRTIAQGKISQDGSYLMNLAGINAGNYKLVLKTNDQVYTKTLIISN
jgi:hypothetical protein